MHRKSRICAVQNLNEIRTWYKEVRKLPENYECVILVEAAIRNSEVLLGDQPTSLELEAIYSFVLKLQQSQVVQVLD